MERGRGIGLYNSYWGTRKLPIPSQQISKTMLSVRHYSLLIGKHDFTETEPATGDCSNASLKSASMQIHRSDNDGWPHVSLRKLPCGHMLWEKTCSFGHYKCAEEAGLCVLSETGHVYCKPPSGDCFFRKGTEQFLGLHLPL